MTAKVPDLGYGDNQKYGMPKFFALMLNHLVLMNFLKSIQYLMVA